MIAQKVYDAVMMDSLAMMSPACYMDFSMDSCSQDELIERFGALQNAARRGATPEQFDAALGNSAKLTKLVAEFGSNVVFPTNMWERLEM